MTGAGFGSKVVLDLTGITYRQLDYWARTGLVGSSIRQARGPGSRQQAGASRSRSNSQELSALHKRPPPFRLPILLTRSQL